MTSDREKCGLSSLLPMSCRGRAEAFARRLHHRLRTLGSQDENGVADENSWLAANENPIAISQPRHSTDAEVYLDYGLLESPGSPEEETYEPGLHRLLNRDNLKHSHSDECHCPIAKEKKGTLKISKATSNDSDSDGSFYDTENDLEQRIANGEAKSESSKSQDSETGICVSSLDTIEEPFATTSDCTPLPSCSLSEDASTLSLRDADCLPLETSDPILDRQECGSDDIYTKCNGKEVCEEEVGYTPVNGLESDDAETDYSSLSVHEYLPEECSTTEELRTGESEVSINRDEDRSEEDRISGISRCSSLETSQAPPIMPINGFEPAVAETEVQHEDNSLNNDEECSEDRISRFICMSMETGVMPSSFKSLNGLTSHDTKTEAQPEDVLVNKDEVDLEEDRIPRFSRCSSIETREFSPVTPINGLAAYDTETDASTEDGSVSKDEDDSEEDRIPRIRRCSSLKTGKTPPGTPGRKKIVRFADVLGLDLADVRTFLDEIPKIPISAYEDLTGVDLNESSLNPRNKSHGVKPDKILMPLFQQPASMPNFLDLIRDSQVRLENAYVEDPLLLSIKGTVRVRNLDFSKSVHVRYTLDSWKSFADVQAVYVDNSCDGFSDKFSFLIYAHTLAVGQRIELACRFQCKGCQYWDNNNGVNYCFQCLPATNSAPVTHMAGIDDWGASFYYQAGTVSKQDPIELDVTSTAIQDFILTTLATKEQAPQKKIDVLTVFVILVFSILFIYLQKAIYFMK